MDFSNVDMSNFKTRTTDKGLEYQLEYQVAVAFRADEGVLRCFCMSNGKTIGSTTIKFTDL